MNASNSWTDQAIQLPEGADPLALLEEGLRPEPVTPSPEWTFLDREEVAAMLPAYEVLRLVGRGGMGAVYEAVQRDLQRHVAIKLLPPSLADKPGLAARFRYESRLMASLQHPGIVKVYEAGETAEGHLYYVMEFVDGEDLASRMQRGAVPVEEATVLIAQVADMLQATHGLGMVHRDVKPANIFLAADGSARLGDFGLAQTADQAADFLRLTRAGTTIGTVEYAAPEQMARSQNCTAASDVYSLGVLAYELLTGELPRGNFDPPSVRNPGVDPAFDSVVLRALQTDPLRRYKDAGEFRTAFLHAADRRQQQELRDQAVRRKMVRRAWMVAALAAIALVTGGSAVVAWQARREADARRAVAESAGQRMAGLFQFLLTDLRQRLEPTGNLGAMDSVMEKAVEHFRLEHTAAGQSPESAVKLADVLAIKGQVIGVRGQVDAADRLYTQALELSKQALRAEPDNITYALRVFEALRERAQHRRLWKNYDSAMEDAGDLVKEADALASRYPHAVSHMAQVEAWIALAAAHAHQKDLEAAHQHFLRAHGLLKKLVASAPGNQQFADKLADLDTALGSNAEARGDYPAMLRHFTSWHDFIVRRHGRDSDMYSHAAFRMGVALQKLGQPEEALLYLRNATALAERESTRFPGHQGLHNHLAWCLNILALCYEDLGRQGEAAPVRNRQHEVLTASDALKKAALTPEQVEFTELAGDPATGRMRWWEFCHRLQRIAETKKGTAAVIAFYEEWLSRATAATLQDPPGSFSYVVTAFLHNRLSALSLENDVGKSTTHAQKALSLREGVAAAHPDDPELLRDVLSSACHAAAAAVKGSDPEAAERALAKIAHWAQRMWQASPVMHSYGAFYQERSAPLVKAAVERWPDRTGSLHKIGASITAALTAPPVER